MCWVDHKSDPEQYHGEIRPEVRAAVEAPHVGDDGLEELKHHHGEDEELDGQSVDLVIVLDLARSVDPGEVIFVHTVLHDEEQQPWGRRVYKIRTVLCITVVWCLPNGLLRLGLEAGHIGALVVVVEGLTAFNVVESDKCDSQRTAETFLCQPLHLLLQPCDLIRVIVDCRHLDIIIRDHQHRHHFPA